MAINAITPTVEGNTMWQWRVVQKTYFYTPADFIWLKIKIHTEHITYFLADVCNVDVKKLHSWLHALGEQAQLPTNPVQYTD